MILHNKQIIKIIIICIILLIIILGIFYLYTYINDNNHNHNNNNNNNNKLEHFTINLQEVYIGTPSPTGNYKPSSSTTYVLTNGIQAVTSNNIGLYALDINSILYSYSSSSNTWISNNINIINPQITNAQFDTSNNNKIICSPSLGGLILSSSISTLFMYNGSLNNKNNVNCIYYLSLNTDGSIPGTSNLNCLALPLISSRIMAEGPIKKGKSAFMVAARRTYIDAMVKPFLTEEQKSNGYY